MKSTVFRKQPVPPRWRVVDLHGDYRRKAWKNQRGPPCGGCLPIRCMVWNNGGVEREEDLIFSNKQETENE